MEASDRYDSIHTTNVGMAKDGGVTADGIPANQAKSDETKLDTSSNFDTLKSTIAGNTMDSNSQNNQTAENTKTETPVVEDAKPSNDNDIAMNSNTESLTTAVGSNPTPKEATNESQSLKPPTPPVNSALLAMQAIFKDSFDAPPATSSSTTGPELKGVAAKDHTAVDSGESSSKPRPAESFSKPTEQQGKSETVTDKDSDVKTNPENITQAGSPTTNQMDQQGNTEGVKDNGSALKTHPEKNPTASSSTSNPTDEQGASEAATGNGSGANPDNNPNTGATSTAANPKDQQGNSEAVKISGSALKTNSDSNPKVGSPNVGTVSDAIPSDANGKESNTSDAESSKESKESEHTGEQTKPGGSNPSEISSPSANGSSFKDSNQNVTGSNSNGEQSSNTESNPRAKESNPSAKESNPSAKESNPSAKESNPSSKESNPSAKESNPCATQSEPGEEVSQSSSTSKASTPSTGAPLSPSSSETVSLGVKPKTSVKPNAIPETQKQTLEESNNTVQIGTPESSNSETSTMSSTSPALTSSSTDSFEIKPPPTVSPLSSFASSSTETVSLDTNQGASIVIPKLNLDAGDSGATDRKIQTPEQEENASGSSKDALKLDPTMKNLYLGVCAFGDLPPLHKKVVRIFVSSTFSDTKEERNALMQHVYPKLAEYCRNNYGLEFQVVDMRWGVPEQAADNHTTTDLCLQEIRKCQQLSVGPCFVAIIGDKYGYRPIPTVIEAPLFDTLATVAPTVAAAEGSSVKWALVQQWYVKDSNTQPVVYVLQPISALIPDVADSDKDKQAAGWKQWDRVNETLTVTLRKTADEACKAGKITEKQQHEFFMSVTENEITEGIFKASGQKVEDTCMCILRKIPDIQQHINEAKAPKFIDLAKPSEVDTEAQSLLSQLRTGKLPTKIHSTNVTQVEIEWSASGAQISLETVEDVDVVKTSQDANQVAPIHKHKAYLDDICSQFFQHISRLVDQGGVNESVKYSNLSSEILQHYHLAKTRTEVFEGREEIIEKVQGYIESQSTVPLTVFGRSGCGKTSLMAKVVQNCCEKTWMGREGKPLCTIVRFLGTTPQTSNLYQLMDSLCQQLSILCGKKWEAPDKFKDMVSELVKLLAKAATKRTILLMLDSIDQLMPTYNAYKMKWLPEELPKNVKVVVSTIAEGYPILGALKERYQKKGAQFVEVEQLGDALGLTVIKRWLELKNRTITSQQEEVVKHVLKKCSLPLYARIVYDHIRKWRSYDTPSLDVLEVTAKGAINQLFEAMETKFGKPIVQHSLSYLTASRHGLSEMELEHLMSLDDELLNQVYKYWRPPVRRIPPLQWTRVRSEVSSYIVERSADDVLVLYWYHRQFIEATKEKYLKDAQFSHLIHSNMVDYFLGRWGGGKAKPFEYTDHQMKRFGLSDKHSAADRKVPLQPYIIAMEKDGQSELRINKRKLFELPFHLYKCKQFDALKQEIFFNFQWLFATLKGASAATVLDELEVFMKADKQMKKDGNMKTLYANLTLIQPYITKLPESLPYELSGRLAKYISQSPLMKLLVRQCDVQGAKYCPLVPMITSFETADLGLQQNINYRAAESWHEGGTMTCSKDFRTIFILDYDDLGMARIKSWDIESGEVVHEVTITRQDQDHTKANIYFQMRLDAAEERMIAFYRGMFSGLHKERYYSNGLVDIIRLSDGVVEHTIEEFLHKEEFTNPVIYSTPNWLALKFGPKTPLFHLKEYGRKIDLTRPHMLSVDEEHFILSYGNKVVIREFETKRECGEFDHVGSVVGAFVAADKSFALTAGPDLGEIKVFDLAKKSLNPEKAFGFLIKPKISITLPTTERDKLDKMMLSCVGHTDKREMRVQFIVSEDMDFAMCIYQNLELWITYLYYIFQGRRLGSFIAQVGSYQKRHVQYPQFSHDSQHIVMVTGKGVEIFSSSTGEKVNEYSMDQPVLDFFVSKVSEQFAVMTSKDVAILSVEKVEEDSAGMIKKGKKKQLKDVTDLIFLPREAPSEKQVQNEYIITQGNTEAQIQEVEGAAHLLDPDPLATARSKRRFAMDTRYTPDGLKVIQLHAKVQVVDTKLEEIKYTPKTGETITRTTVGSDGKGVNETIQIPTGTARSEVLEMQPSDRIVNEHNKIKFRLTSNNPTRIMSVPSQITVYSATDGKMKRLQRFNVYLESIVEVSNTYMITQKKKSSGEFINIYELESGRLLATHQTQNGFGTARILPSESMMLTVDQDLLLRTFEAPNFTSCEMRIEAHQGNTAGELYSIRDIIFPVTSSTVPDSIIIFYKALGGNSDICYNFIEMTSKKGKKVSKTVVKYQLEDISKDGTMGIDPQLDLYNLAEGRRMKRVPYTNRSDKMRLLARLSDDKKHVVFVDKYDDTLHLVAMSGDGVAFTHLASVYTHAPWMDFFSGLSLRLQGRVIVIKAGQGDSVVFLRILGEDTKLQQYISEGERALALVPDAPGIDSLIQQKNENAALRRLLIQEKVTLNAMNPIKTMTDDYYLKKFRFRRETVKLITDIVKPYIESISREGPPAELQVLLALAFYATGDSHKINITDAQKFSEETVDLAVKSVTQALLKEKHRYVAFPTSSAEINKAFDAFSSIANFPKVAAILDGVHVKLNNTTGYNMDKFFNGGWHSLNCMVCCDAAGKFVDVSAFWMGWVSDANIFKDSKLNSLLDNAADKYHCVLLGDSAYPCLRYLMTPIANATTPAEVAYNKAHEKTHAVMGQTLSSWQSRFPALTHGLNILPDLAAQVVEATCILHNIAVAKAEPAFREDPSPLKSPALPAPLPPTYRGEQMRKQIVQGNLGRT